MSRWLPHAIIVGMLIAEAFVFSPLPLWMVLLMGLVAGANTQIAIRIWREDQTNE